MVYFWILFLAYLIAALLFFYSAAQAKYSYTRTLMVLSLWVVSGLLGAKLFHVLFEARAHPGIASAWELLQADPWHGLRLNDPGYVFYGGLLLALLTTWRYLPLYGDLAVRPLCLGLLIGRLGCYWVGCCYGVLGIPVQLAEAGFALWAFLKVKHWQAFLKFYAIWRFFIEFLRADDSRGLWALGLSTSQWISLGVLGFCAYNALTKRLKSAHMPRTRI